MAKNNVQNERLNDLLAEYCNIFNNTYSPKTLGNFKSRIKAIQDLADKCSENVFDWLQQALNEDNPDCYAMEKFDELLSNSNVGWGTKSIASKRSAYKKFVSFVLGQYHANLYMSLISDYTELEFCKLVAKYALFCKVEIAEKVKNGHLGSNDNNGTGNDYYSWFFCMYQRKSGKNQKVGNIVLKNGCPVTFKGKNVKYDSNNMANQAIKKAVNAGLTYPLTSDHTLFDGYMACHIWDGSCNDNLFHTSVFNLVLLPKSIGGLSDYNDKVKHLLQYEAAWCFGVYPDKYNNTNMKSQPQYYTELEGLWRQPQEHKIALDNISNKSKTPLGL